MVKIVAATGNDHKLREFREILEPRGITVLGARDVGGIPDVEEDGDSFRYHAEKKALETADYCRLPALADDSGLEVFALDNRPGVFSARYAGEKATDEDNLNLLLENMRGLTDREARFRCVIALADVEGEVSVAEGAVKGRIIETPKGKNGFGYDPVFVPDGYKKTFAELPPETKNHLSHRSIALQNAVKAGLFEGLSSEF